jgi:2,3-dimethylmalate lyase
VSPVTDHPGAALRRLLGRDQVLAVLGAPSARTAKIMERAGVEAAFVGTGITFGNYTALPDVGVASSSECLQFGGYIARAVSFPVLIDADTGHGGPPAVRRFVHEAIRQGLAGVRLDDQRIEAKRATQSAGIEIVGEEEAVERYQAAVAARDEVDPSFVVMAQCYARDAADGGLDVLCRRLSLYETDGHCDWVQFESPHSVEEIQEARRSVKGVLSAMRGKLPNALSLEEHANLGLDAAWYTFLPGQIADTATLEFLTAYANRGHQVFTEWEAGHAELIRTLRAL